MFTVYKKYLPFFKSANEVVQRSHPRFYAQFLMLELKDSKAIITATDGYQAKQFIFSGHDDKDLTLTTFLNKGQVDALVKGKADFEVTAEKIAQGGTEYKTAQKFSYPRTEGIWPVQPKVEDGILVNQAFIGDPFPKTPNGVRLYCDKGNVLVTGKIDGVECKYLFTSMVGDK
jgi:hypothetical protein